MKKYNEMTIVLTQAEYERVERGMQDEVYLDIDMKNVKRLVTEEGQRNLLIKTKRDNALINAALDAWGLGYANKLHRITLRFAVSRKQTKFKVKNVLIRTSKAEWDNGNPRLCFVVRLGEVIEK